jgi:hypothetical protein
MGAERSSIFLLDPLKQQLTSYSSLDLAKQEIRMSKSTGVAGWVLEHRMPAVINDAYNDSRFFRGVDDMTGFPDRALTKSREAVRLAEEFEHPFSLALALDYTAIFHQFRREAEPAQQRAEAAINVFKEHKFSYYLGWAMIIKGWAIAELGNCEDGINEIKQGLEILRDTGAKRSLPYYLSLLATVYVKDGRPETKAEIDPFRIIKLRCSCGILNASLN